MYKPHKAAKSRHALAWLGTEPGFAQLRERTRRLAALQEDLRRCVPGVALDAMSLENGVLVVGAAQAAVAARIRQVGPSILAELNRRGWKVERIRFKPRLAPSGGPRREPKQPLGANAVASVAALSESVTDPKLREALRRLARRHGGT
jgi:hypothetical protein